MNPEATRKSRLPALKDRFPLGSKGLQVSPVCVGMVIDPNSILEAFDEGVNFFFYSADMHWPYYEPTRKGLETLLARGGGIRDQIVVGAVSYATQPEFCETPFQEALEAVRGLERLDLLIAGGAYGYEYHQRVGVFQKHRKTGFLGCKAVGTSFHDRTAAATAINNALVDISFIRYNPDHPGALWDLFPEMESGGPTGARSLVYNFKSTIGYVAPENFPRLGLNTKDYWVPEWSDYYRYALTRPQVDGLLIGPSQVGEVRALGKALGKGPLTAEEENFLVNLASIARGDAQIEKEDPAK